MFVILAAVLTFAIAAALIYVGGYLVIGLGYLLYGAVVSVGWIIFIAGWTVWKLGVVGYRVLDWSVDKLAPPIAAWWHRWRDSKPAAAEPVTAEQVTAERLAPSPGPGVLYYGFGHPNLARVPVIEPPRQRTCAVVHFRRRPRPRTGRSLRR